MHHISKVYRTELIETHALRDFSLKVDEGEFVAVTGPSGSGKTTFLNIAGLLETFDSGIYRLDGESVNDLNDDARSRIRNQKIGFIFQSFNLIPDLDLFDNVDVPLRYRGLNAEERRRRITQALELVGLASRMAEVREIGVVGAGFMARFSLEGRIALLTASGAILTGAIAVALERAFDSVWLSLIFTFVITLPVIAVVSRRFARPLRRTLRALSDGISSLRDNDFSVSIAARSGDELGELVTAYNSLGGILREERQDLFQRELLLDTVIQSTPLALVLTSESGRVLYSNLAARQLFHAGRKLEGLELKALLSQAPPALREAFAAERDTLFTVPIAGEPEIFHLSRRGFLLNARPHQLYLLKQLTRELNAQEVAT